MNYKELMPDDLINTETDGYVRVIFVTPTSVVYLGGICPIKQASPIPLTEEILVKNGFERCDYNNKYFIINDVIDLIAPKWRDGTEYYACTWYQDEFDDTVQHIEICKCAYVHQLQHLLGMVGVQKKIEL